MHVHLSMAGIIPFLFPSSVNRDHVNISREEGKLEHGFPRKAFSVSF